MRWWDGLGWTEQVQAAPFAPHPQGQEPFMRPGAISAEPWYKKTRYQVGGAVLAMLIVGGAIGGDPESSEPPAAAGDVSSEGDSKTPDRSTSEESGKKAAVSDPATKPKPKPKSTPKPAAPRAMPVDAATMLEEFEGNEAAADVKYQGKTLRVTGVVEKVDTEWLDEDEYIVEMNGGGDWDIWSVNCNDVSTSQAAKIQVGSTVTMIGTFDDGGDLGVELKSCRPS